MVLDFELAISCAFAALVILRLVHYRREWRSMREKLNSIATAEGDARDTGVTTKRGDKHASPPKSAGTSLFVDRLIIYLLVLALLWFGGRIWMQY